MAFLGAILAVLGGACGALAILIARTPVAEGVLRLSVGQLPAVEIAERWVPVAVAATTAATSVLLALATGLFVAAFHRSRSELIRRISGEGATLEARARLLRERISFLEQRVEALERTRAELEERKRELEAEVADLEDRLERQRTALRLAERGGVVVARGGAGRGEAAPDEATPPGDTVAPGEPAEPGRDP
jgi:TolA-binding protein